ncbi:hypothetical protein [Metasolibacillus sp. FSL K6-0083]|uniref:hypothetical protein n=1 Tax=Metasolibacillus sp. FSL K6-0083 TaxID=2921416 RepID=UPI00315A6106
MTRKDQNYIRSELYIIEEAANVSLVIVLGNENLYNELVQHEQFVVHVACTQVEKKHFSQLVQVFEFTLADTLAETVIIEKESYPAEQAQLVLEILNV